MFNIVLTKLQIASSKAVVRVDRPIKALSMHIQKWYKGIIVTQLSFCQKKKKNSTRLLHVYVQCVYIV